MNDSADIHGPIAEGGKPLIKEVRLERFKGLEDVTLVLDRMTVLVGPNNAGKSSVLQGLQFATSAVQSIILLGKNRWKNDTLSGTLSFDQLVYAPLRDVQTLALGGRLPQKRDDAINISFRTESGEETSVAVSRGKNSNLSVTCHGESLGRELESLTEPFCVIAPGLAGIPSFEEFRSEGIVRRAAARGDANGVFRNVLWILKTTNPSAWDQFQERLHQVFPEVAVDITFDVSSDEHLRATVETRDTLMPIDSAGTGVLQAAQVFAYIGVYHPRLLILDEPDAHLHPNNQRKLVRLLAEVAESDGFQALISTHSRHVLDEARAIGSAVRWVSAGKVTSASSDVVQELMDLGALDAHDRLRNGDIDWVVLTEDTNTKALKVVLSAAGFDLTRIDIWSYGTASKVDSAITLGKFIKEHASGTRILVHRDRDFATGDEWDRYVERLKEHGMEVLATPGTDIESFFLTADHLRHVYSDLTTEDFDDWLGEAVKASRERSIEKFINSRVDAAHQNRGDGEKRPNVGKITQQVQDEYESDPLRFSHGKTTLGRLKEIAQRRTGLQRELLVATNALPVDDLRNMRQDSADKGRFLAP